MATAADSAPALCAVQAGLFGLGKAREHVIEQIGKLGGAQAGQLEKHGWIPTQVIKATDDAEPTHRTADVIANSIADRTSIVNVILWLHHHCCSREHILQIAVARFRDNHASPFFQGPAINTRSFV
jgi:hypothetical protein